MMMRRRELWLVASLVLVAFTLRIAELDARSLWLDESFTLLRINGSWAEMVTNTVMRQGVFTTDLNPPLYFAMLKLWREWSGNSVFALRVFSASWATLIVPLTYILGRRLFASAGVGAFAAVLATLCPAYQWYAAELRMYAMMACLGATSSYFLYRAVQSEMQRSLWFSAWLLVTAASLFTHFSFIGLTLGQFALLLIAGLSRIRRLSDLRLSHRTWLVAGMALLALVVLLTAGSPTIARAAQLAGDALWAPRGQGAPPLDFIREIIGATIFGLNAGDPTGGWLVAFVGLLIVLGVCLPFSRRHRMARMLLVAAIAAPVLFWLSLSYLIENYPSFRYVIFIVPALHIAVAHAIYAMPWRDGAAVEERPSILQAMRVPRRVVGVGLLIAVVCASAFGLAFTFARTPTWQDDWRSMANYLRQQWQPGDVIVINLNTPEVLLPVYLRDLPAPIATVNEWASHPTQDLRRTIADQYRRVWYANTGGDEGYQNREAQAILTPYLLRSRVSFPARTTIIELLEYDLHPVVVQTLPEAARPVAGSPADQTAIAGYAIEPGNPYHTHANFRLTLYWRRGAAGDLASHNVVVRLHTANETWLDWVLPAKLVNHPAWWHEQMLYRVSYIVPVPLGLPSQPYTLELQVRAGDKGEPIQTFSEALTPGDLNCCIRIVQWPTDKINPTWRADDGTLFIAEHPSVVRPGEPMPVVLTWQPARDGLAPWQTRLALRRILGGDLATTQRIAGTPDFPVGAWPAGEWVRDQYVLDVPFSARPGWYLLQLERWRDGRRVDDAFLGLVHLEDYPRTPVTTQVQHPVRARVGELSLLGYSVNGPVVRGRTYDFITHWRVEQTPARDGVLFLHMVGPNGQLISQDDNPPIVDGKLRSTLTYRAGDGIDQTHRLSLPGDLPAGEYKLFAGIYDREGGLRWPAQQDGRPARDDLILVGVITLN